MKSINLHRLAPTPEAFARLMLPQTLLFLLLLTVALLTLSVVVRQRFTYKLDLAATLYLQRLKSSFLTQASHAATFLGNSLTLILLGVGVFLVSAVAGQPWAGVFVLLSLLSLLLNTALKKILSRERPGEKEVQLFGGPRWGFSYPSGHSMGAAAFYGVTGTMMFLLVANPWIKFPIVGICFLIPIACGLSRIYLGAHWMSDVVAGWTGGVLVALAVTVLYAPVLLIS